MSLDGDRLAIRNSDNTFTAADIRQKPPSGTSNTHTLFIQNTATSGAGQALVIESKNSTTAAATITGSGDLLVLKNAAGTTVFTVDNTGTISGGSGSDTIGGTLLVEGTTAQSAVTTLTLGNGTAGSRNLYLRSSFSGGDDDGAVGHFDSTSRILLESYQRAGTNNIGEITRIGMKKSDAKAMITWQFPNSYDGSGDPVGTLYSKVWMGAHWDSTGHTGPHGHWSMETPDATDLLRTRFSIDFADTSSGYSNNPGDGLDKTLIATNQADFLVRTSYTTYGVGDGTGRAASAFRLKGDAGLNMDVEFGRADDNSNRRWVIRNSSDAESGSNAGALLQIIGYSDSGALLGTAFQIARDTGAVTVGVTSSYRGGLTVNKTTSTAMTVSHTGTGGTSYLATTADTTSRVVSASVSGDANQRVVIYSDGKHEWGAGSSTRDTNLYRNAADQLKTDDSFVVGARLTVGSSLNAAQFYSLSDGSISASTFATSADGTASLGTVVINPFSASKRALDIRLTADTVSRLRIDESAGSGSGTITFGDGTTADVNLYRSAANKLKSDDMVIAALGLGVGNSASATVGVGILANKMEVFDASGASLGFVPIYASIT